MLAFGSDSLVELMSAVVVMLQSCRVSQFQNELLRARQARYCSPLHTSLQ